jgi:hypothetical protein
MAYEQKDLEGSLFRNDDKEEGSKHPDYKGSATINGVQYWLSSWLNTGKNGKKYMQIRFKAKEDRAQSAAPKGGAPKPKVADDFNDSVPF